jgi:hypothetical protein
MGSDFDFEQRSRSHQSHSHDSHDQATTASPAPGKQTLVDDLHSPVQWLNYLSGTPGKQTRVEQAAAQSRYVDNDYVLYGTACDADPATPGCFLSERDRDRFAGWIRDRIAAARENYKDAIGDVKLHLLTKKSDELHWLASLAFDLIGAHFSFVAAAALKGLREKGLRKLWSWGVTDMMYGADSSEWQRRAMAALHAATPVRIDTAVRVATGFALPRLKEAARQYQNTASTAEVGTEEAYLNSLRDSCNIHFEQFAINALARASDADLVVLYEMFDPKLHETSKYVNELNAKLARFKKSGVPEIGHGRTQLFEGHLETTTRVILVQDIYGKQRPWYAVQGSYYANGRANHGELQLDRPVPDEFCDVAIAVSEARFGKTPVIDDGYVAMLRSAGVDPAAMRSKLQSGK